MDEQKRKRRQEEFRRIDERLRELPEEHPVLAWLLAFGLAVGVFLVAMVLKQFFEWLGR
jgi:hypothetical protein